MHANEGAPTGWHGALPRSLLEDALVRKLLILSPTADALGKCDYRLPLTRGLAPSDTWTARLMLLCREMVWTLVSPLGSVFTPGRALKARS